MLRRKDPSPLAPRPTDPVVYSVKQFCSAHQISKSTLYGLFGSGEGPAAVRVGRRVLITAEAAQAWRRKLAESAERQP